LKQKKENDKKSGKKKQFLEDHEVQTPAETILIGSSKTKNYYNTRSTVRGEKGGRNIIGAVKIVEVGAPHQPAEKMRGRRSKERNPKKNREGGGTKFEKKKGSKSQK